MEPSRKGSEMVRLAMMLQEASAISKSLNKPLVRMYAAECIRYMYLYHDVL